MRCVVRARTDAKDFKETDSVLIQIQRVFQNLASSSERFYDPSHFCTNFKGWDVSTHAPLTSLL